MNKINKGLYLSADKNEHWQGRQPLQTFDCIPCQFEFKNKAFAFKSANSFLLAKDTFSERLWCGRKLQDEIKQRGLRNGAVYLVETKY